MSNSEKDYGRTTLLEPEVDKTQLAKDILFPKRAEKRKEQQLKKQRELEELEEEQTKKKVAIEKEQEVPKPFVLKEKQKEEKEETFVEEQPEEVALEEEEQTEKTEEVEQETAKLETLAKPKKSLKLRLKLIVAVYIATLVGFGSWAIYNAVDNNNLANQVDDLERTQIEIEQSYDTSTKALEKLIKKLGSLDKDKLGENVQNMEEAGIIELKPQELVEPTNFKPKSNWFDKLCNWVSGIFGG